MAQKHGHLEKKRLNVYKLLRCGSGARWRKSAGQHTCQMKKYWVWWITTLSGARHQATSSQLDRSCPKTGLSAEDCTRREDGRKRDTRKFQENQEERCWTYSWSKRTRRSVTRSWREELKTESSGTIINWTCLRAEHTKERYDTTWTSQTDRRTYRRTDDILWHNRAL